MKRGFAARMGSVVGALFLSLAALSANSAALVVVLDTDNNPATGCTITTVAGNFIGAEWVLTTDVDTAVNPPVVGAVTQQQCVVAPAGLSAPMPVAVGGWQVGVGLGVGGYDVIETFFPIATPPAAYRVGFFYTDPIAGTDILFTSGGIAGAPPIIFALPALGTQIPTLTEGGIFLLALLFCVIAGRALRSRRIPTTLVVGLFAVIMTSAALAAIALDGQISDWAGIRALSTDPMGDSPSGSDISAVFAKAENGRIYFRADVKTAAVPGAMADTYSTLAGAPLVVPAPGVLSNDNLGIPAAPVTSFGGGNATGISTTFAAGTTDNAFGAGGSLSVAANGGLNFTPATGFSGAFLFSYVITNPSGSSTGQVTINVNEAPAITSANSATFAVGAANTFTVTTTGYPNATVTLTGCTLPTGVTFTSNAGGTGTLAGTPAAGTGGTYACTVNATNGIGAPATQAFSLTVNQAPAITSGNAATFVAGAAGTFTVTTTGFPTNASMGITQTGALPTGVTFVNNNNGTATLAGTPGAATGGTYPIVITANNGVAPNAVQAFTLTVTQPAAITSANAATFNVGAANTFAVTTTGFLTPAITFTACTPALPAGVTFTDNANGTATLAGNPPPGSSNVYNCTVTATNGVGGPATQGFALTVQEGPVAADDGYTVAHDTLLTVPAVTGLLSNDTLGAPPATMFSVSSPGPVCTVFPCVIGTTQGGAATIQSDGSFTYQPAANFAGTDGFSYNIANISGNSGAAVTLTVTNVAPVADLNGPVGGINFGPVAFAEGAVPTALVDPAQMTVTDADDANIESATVTITNPLDQPDETIGVTCPVIAPGCSGLILAADVTYNPVTGVLTILKSAPLADYQALLRTLAYSNASQDPDTTTRGITVEVDDGISANSPLAQVSVTLTATNNAPVVTAPAAVTTAVNTAHAFAGTVSVADVDAGAANVQVTLTATNGTVALSTTAGLTVVGNGSASVTSTGPLTAQNTALNGMAYTPATGYNGAATLQVDISDLGNTGTGGALTDSATVNITVDNLPTVTSTVPVNGAASVADNATITVNFSEPVTITGSAFTLQCPVPTAIPFTVSPAGPAASYVLTPTGALPSGVLCTVTVVANQVTDSAAQNPAANFVFSFTVNSRPTVTSTVPANGATGIALVPGVAINFSESVNATLASFTLACPVGSPQAFTITSSPAASFTLTPSAPLPVGTACTVTVVAAQVTDADASQNMAANFVFTFTTATPPAFTSAASTQFTEGVAGTFAVTTTGNPLPSLTRTGTLPGGVTFVDNGNGTGTLSGTPAGGSAGASPYAQVFTATNIAGAPTQNFTLQVCPVLGITPAGLPQPTTGNAYSQALAGTGGSGTYTFAGTPPAGITLSGAGLLSSANVTATGAYSFVVTVTDTITTCTGTATFSGTINAPPVIGADSYQTVGGTELHVGSTPSSNPRIVVASNVLANDTNGDGGGPGVGLSIGAASVGTFATVNGGSITMASDGTFSYTPAAGYTGADSFAYTVSDGVGTANATLALTVLTPRFWYVDNTAAAGGNGTSTSRFNTMAAAIGASGIGDTIYVFFGDGTAFNQNAGAVLKNNQRLIGQGVLLDATVTVNGVGNPTLKAAGATPTIGNAGGNGITLASNNTVRGLSVSTSTGGFGILGANVGTLDIGTVTVVNTGGGALDLSNGTVTVAIGNTSSSAGANGVKLAGINGTVGLGNGSLTGATGHAFDVGTGTANITYTGTITTTTALMRAVSIVGKTGGTVALSGNVTSIAAGTTAGIFLNSNTGATINFTGTLNLSTGANAAFTATGGGTVTATGAGSTIATVAGTALNVANTTIGAGGLNFVSITSGTGTGNGIILDTTGVTAGLTVTGDGANTAVGGNGSGGTIANKSGADGSTTQGIGIYLNSTRNVVLRRMVINGTNQNYGIKGTLVDGFTLEYSTVSGTQGTAATRPAPENAGEGAIYFGNVTTNGLTGAGVFTSNLISGGRARNLSIINTAGTATLTFLGNSFGLIQNFSDANQSLAVEARNAGTTINATLGGAAAGQPNSFTGAPGDLVNFTGQTATTMNVTMLNNALSNSHAQNIIGGGGLTLATQGTMAFDVQNNTFRDADGSAVTMQLASAGTLLNGKFLNNTIGVSGLPNSGSETGNGLFGSFAGAGTVNLNIANNTIRQYAGNAGMYFDNTGGSYTANFTIVNNVMDQPGPAIFAGLAITNGAPASTDTINVCADIRNNDFSAADPNNVFDVILGISGANAGHTFRLPGYAGTTLAQVEAFVKGSNLNAAATVVGAYSDSPPDTMFVGGAACPTPP